MTTITEAGTQQTAPTTEERPYRPAATPRPFGGRHLEVPNHLQGIIVIVDDPRRGDSRIAPTPPGAIQAPATQRARSVPIDQSLRPGSLAADTWKCRTICTALP